MKVLFVGSKKLGYLSLIKIHELDPESLIGVVTIDDTNDKRSYFLEIIEYCKSNSIPIYKPYILNVGQDFDLIVKKLKQDIVFVMCWYWIISKECIDSVPKGFIGIHNSLLPLYRGGSPLVWSIINGEKYVGFTMFSIKEGIDDGNIWFQNYIFLEHDYYIEDILDKLTKLSIEALNNIYFDIIMGRVKSFTQNHKFATYCAQRIPVDGLIDWNWTDIQVYNFIRAQTHPYPGAFFKFKNNEFIVNKVETRSNIIFYGTPGQLIKYLGDYGIVCGNNRIVIIKEIINRIDKTKTILKLKDLNWSMGTRLK